MSASESTPESCEWSGIPGYYWLRFADGTTREAHWRELVPVWLRDALGDEMTEMLEGGNN